MKAVIYFTEVPQQYEHKNMEHMIGEKLLATGLYKEYGLKLAFEPRATGEHGKPFLTLQPKIHYNITHSGKYVMCIIADQEIGIDVQVHKKVNYERMLERMVPADMIREILDSDEPEKAFFTQWVLREAYIKWTGGDSLILFRGEKNEPFGLLFLLTPPSLRATSPIFFCATHRNASGHGRGGL